MPLTLDPHLPYDHAPPLFVIMQSSLIMQSMSIM